MSAFGSARFINLVYERSEEKMSKQIYLDNAATTQMSDAVKQAMSIQFCIRNFMHHTLDQIIAKHNFFLYSFSHVSVSNLCCFRHSGNSGYILRTGTFSSLLTSAMDKRWDINAITDIQKANALWPMKFRMQN